MSHLVLGWTLEQWRLVAQWYRLQDPSIDDIDEIFFAALGSCVTGERSPKAPTDGQRRVMRGPLHRLLRARFKWLAAGGPPQPQSGCIIQI